VSLVRNAGYNLVGSILPIVLGLATVPVYIKLVGVERYGVLAIAWLLLGYFGLFDLGLSRATAHRIAALKDASEPERAATFWTAIGVNAGMGLIGGLILWPVASWYFQYKFNVQADLRDEIVVAVPLLALSVPVATSTGVLVGALQGREKFLETNTISVTSTTLFQLFPLLVAWLHGPNLTWLLWAALAARFIALVALWMRCSKHVIMGHGFRFDREQMIPLMKFGGWVTIASIFSPLLVIVDRFIIGAVIGAVAVAIYNVPFQLAQRISIIPTALGGALFPRLSSSRGEEQQILGRKASQTLASLMSLPVLWVILLFGPFLRLWVGAKIGVPATPIGKILVLGYWANAFAIVSYVRLQARGRPDLVTKMLLIQIPPYLGLLWFAIHRFGLVGAAATFSLRCAADYVLLSLAAGREFPSWRLIALNFCILLGTIVGTEIWQPSLMMTGVLLLVGTTIVGGIGWFNMPDDIRDKLLRMVARFLPRAWRAA
jgi:O-antigen/teichoic acid export membrane protein